MPDKSPIKPSNGLSFISNFINPTKQYDNQNNANNNRQVRNMNEVTNNSILDITPRENHFVKSVNPNYSEELFFKKKTMSKNRNQA